MAVPAYIKEPSISGKSLSTEQTSSDISPEHFPSNLTICSWGISWGRGQSFVFNSLHLISDPAQLPFEPAQTCGTEEEHSLATSCVREALCACLLRALPSASIVPSGPCIGTGNNRLLKGTWRPELASTCSLCYSPQLSPSQPGSPNPLGHFQHLWSAFSDQPPALLAVRRWEDHSSPHKSRHEDVRVCLCPVGQQRLQMSSPSLS